MPDGNLYGYYRSPEEQRRINNYKKYENAKREIKRWRGWPHHNLSKEHGIVERYSV